MLVESCVSSFDLLLEGNFTENRLKKTDVRILFTNFMTLRDKNDSVVVGKSWSTRP